MFRELLQNADDANAAAIEIHFQTTGEFTDINALKGSTYSKCTVRNDGIVFRDEDWSRLKCEGIPRMRSVAVLTIYRRGCACGVSLAS